MPCARSEWIQLSFIRSDYCLDGSVASWLEYWPEGLIGLDADNRIVFLSKRAIDILKIAPSLLDVEAGSKNIHDLVCSHSRGYHHEIDDCPLHKQISAQATQVNSTIWLMGSGENVYIDYRLMPFNSAKCSALISFLDSSELTHNQEELNNFADYVDNSPAPMGEFDIDGQLVYGNTALQNGMLDLGFSDLGEPRFFPLNLSQLCHEVAAEAKSLSDIEVEVDGQWYNWHLHPLTKGQEVSVAAYGFNITEQKAAQALVEKEKAAARRDFYAKMIHELRTPLNAIIGFSQILIRRCEDTLSEREFLHLRSIHAAGLQLNDMVTDTLDYSKIEAGKMSVQMESFRLSAVIKDIQAQMETLANTKKLDYSVICDDDLVIFSDRMKVRQILVNLISNAIKYTRKGFVNVSIEEREVDEVGEAIVVQIKDSGMGISKQQQEKLFAQYQRVEREENREIQGTGLGLALVADLLELLNGRIDVESEIDVGSTFTLILPLGEEDDLEGD